MKKLISIILALIMLIALVSCADTNTDLRNEITNENSESIEDTAPQTFDDTEDVEIDNTLPFNITVISGTTGMGFAKLMNDAKEGNTSFNYNFEIVSGADVVAPAIINGSTDIAAVPTNLAAVLYAKTKGEIQILAANTLGVLYVIENGESVNSVSDLAGKTVYCCQQGANPEFISNYLFAESGLEIGKDVFLDFTYNTPDELATAIATGAVDIAILPEPKVTATLVQNENLRRAINMSDLWNDVTGGLPLIQGVIVARKSFVEEHGAEVEHFLREYEASIEFTSTNKEEAAEMIAAAGIIPKAPLALKALPFCNLTFLSENDIKEPLMSFFNVLFVANPASVGGALPTNDIFYGID